MCFHDINDALILQLTADSHFTSVVWLLGVCACLMITSVVWVCFPHDVLINQQIQT